MNALFTVFVFFQISAHAARTPEERKALFAGATQELKASGIEKKIPKVGEKFPDIVLGGKKVSQWLNSGKLIVTFYRGGWCPYCVKQLKEISAGLRDIENDGAKLIAISPESENEVKMTAGKNNLNFLLLSDKNNEFARKLNLVFRVPDVVNDEYKGLGIDLEKNQGNKTHELPIPATFVINTKGLIDYAFADADYTQRAPTEEILKALRKP